MCRKSTDFSSAFDELSCVSLACPDNAPRFANRPCLSVRTSLAIGNLTCMKRKTPQTIVKTTDVWGAARSARKRAQKELMALMYGMICALALVSQHALLMCCRSSSYVRKASGVPSLSASSSSFPKVFDDLSSASCQRSRSMSLYSGLSRCISVAESTSNRLPNKQALSSAWLD
jgi:hypothetical protein